jgi:DNA-binding NarL/FixJ family response regulator
MGVIRVMIVDDQALIRRGIQSILECEPDMAVVATAANGLEAVEAARTAKPDVILMDLHMPVLDGVASTQRILRESPDTKIIVLTVFDDDNSIFEGVLSGAAGYLMKDVSADELIKAVRAVVQSGAIMTPTVALKVLRQFGELAKERGANVDPPHAAPSPAELPEGSFGLTRREWDILACLAEGMTNKEIAATLHIADGTGDMAN